MGVLLIESSPGLALELEDRLTDAGHRDRRGAGVATSGFRHAERSEDRT
jgi:hypothetical protein